MNYSKAVGAAALLAVGSTAYAQSSVTLYGLLDVGLEYKNQTPAANGARTSQAKMANGNLLGNRWGLKGVEDIGGGTKVIFTLESGFTLTDGASSQGGRLFGRKAFVGLDTRFGIVTLGRQNNLVYENVTPFDPALLVLYSASTYDAFLVGRMDNSVKYQVSSHGLFFGSMYSTGYETVSGQGQLPGNSKVGREYEFVATYKKAGFGGFVGFDQQQGTSIATQDNAVQRFLLAASYEVGPAKVSGGWRWLNGQNGASAQSANLFWGGGTWQFDPFFSLAVSGYHMQMKQTHNGPSSVVLFADYWLSKSTDLYALFSHLWNSKRTNLGVEGQALNTGYGVAQTGAIVGIRHTF
jgi:predicted porin